MSALLAPWAGIGCMAAAGAVCAAEVPEWVVYPVEEWESITPEEAGIRDVDAWDQWVKTTREGVRGAAFQGEDHSGNKWGVAIARGGYLIQAFGDPDYRYQTASLGKTFTKACLQLAVDHGVIESADDLISKYWTGEGQLNSPHKYLNQGHHSTLTFRHLSEHKGGFPITNGWSWKFGQNYGQPAPEWAKCTRDPDYDNYAHTESGSVYHYSSGGYWRLAQALTAAWNRDLKEVIDEKLFGPMGIAPEDWEWTLGKTMHDDTDAYPKMPGYGLFIDPPYEIGGNDVVGGQWVVMSAKDLARFGLLVATGGVWQGKHLISHVEAGGGGNSSQAAGVGGDVMGSLGIVTSTFKGTTVPWHLFAEPPAPGKPHVKFAPSTTGGEVPLDMHFRESSRGRGDATIAKWAWQFGDGAESQERNPRHTYTEPGTYIARLTVTDSEGRAQSSEATILVAAPDTAPPTVERVSAAGDPRTVAVVFSEAVERRSAETPANYAIAPDISITAAFLREDGWTAVLTTTEHTPGTTYTLRVANVTDRARQANTLLAPIQVEYEYAMLPMAGLRLWLKADAGPTTDADSRVSVRTDQSANGHHAVQSDPAGQPLLVTDAANGLPALRFDGRSSWMSGDVGSVRAPLAVFVVGRFEKQHQPAGDYDYLISLGQWPNGPRLSVSRFADGDARGPRDSYYSLYKVGQNLLGPPLPGQQLLVISALHGTQPPRHRLFINGVEAAVPDDPESLPEMDGGYTLGAWPARNIPHHLDGVIAEVLVYDVELVETERQAVEGYLMGRYGMAGAPPG